MFCRATAPKKTSAKTMDLMSEHRRVGHHGQGTPEKVVDTLSSNHFLISDKIFTLRAKRSLHGSF